MPTLTQIFPEYDVDAVLRGQGADPQVIRGRRPAMVRVAEQALAEAAALVEPAVYYRQFAVQGVRHESLLLEGGHKLTGKLVAQQLAGAERLYVILCTIGSSVEQYSAELWSDSASYSLAVDGVGSAAVEALANAACRYFEEQAAGLGWQTSVPLSPGMVDWPIDVGQPQIFELLQDEQQAVSLTPSCIMLPKKTLTMVLGAGPELSSAGRTCDFCNLRDVCRYQAHYS
ncbi:MAG: hypothetical protein ACKOC5_17410 [Chloroflexota bacterium]